MNTSGHVSDSSPTPMLWHDRLSIGLIGLLAVGLTGSRTLCAHAVTQSLSLCASTLIPALFPFFVLSNLAVETGFSQRLGTLFAKPMARLFRLPGSTASLFLLGALGGYPTGARAVVRLYQQKACSKPEAQRMLPLCNNCGPGFFFGVVGGVVLHHTAAGVMLWLVHLFAAFLAAFLCRCKVTVACHIPKNSACAALPQALTQAVSGAVQSTLGVCGFVLFFSVLLSLLRYAGLFSLLTSVLSPITGDTVLLDAFFSGLLEISCGVTALAASTAAPIIKGSIAAFLLSFGGISVLFQTLQQTEDTDLSIRLLVKQKLLQAVFSALFSIPCLYLLFYGIPAFSFSALIRIFPLWLLLFSLFSLVKGKKSRYNTKKNCVKGASLYDL